jgi:hypothetical protein
MEGRDILGLISSEIRALYKLESKSARINAVKVVFF